MWIIKVILGVIGGVVGGMGMGGGTLIIPLLTIFLGFNQISAQGINLIAFLPMSLVAIYIHSKNKLIDFKHTWFLALVGVIFSLIGAIVANHISSGILRKLFALFLIGLGIWQLIEIFKDNQKQDKKE